MVALVISAGHSYWFHSHDPRDGVGPHPSRLPAAVELVQDQGIVGDRFFGRTSGLASAVSFLAVEAVDEVAALLGRPAWPAPGSLDPRLLRRNVVVRGVDLNALRHERFTLAAGCAPVGFEAAGQTAPCAWMDAVLAPGARSALRGRGGLRARPTCSGRLVVGPATLDAGPVVLAGLDPARAGAPAARRRRLP